MHNSHTHCQVTQADPPAKTWQRVCLSNRTLNPTDNHTYKKNNEGTTSYIKHLAVSALSRILTRIKSSWNLTGKCFEMPNVSYTRPLPATLKKCSA
jgi:hypothetical protein